jgi:DNA mismatch repair protein MSH4
MKMLYKVADGYEEEKFYGLALARVVDLPKDVITTATKVSKALHRDHEARKSNTNALLVSRRRRLILGLREQLVLAKNGNLEGEELRQWLKRLQDEFVVRMQAIEAESALALAGREGTAQSGEDSKSRPSVDQEDQAAEFPTNQGENASSAADGTLSSFATPQRPMGRRESQSSFA